MDGHIRIAQLMIDKGADVNQCDEVHAIIITKSTRSIIDDNINFDSLEDHFSLLPF